MADIAYSNWCARAWTPSGASATRQYRARLDTQLNTYDTYCTMSCWLYLELTRTVSHSGYHWGASNGATGTGSSVFEDSKIYYFYGWTTGAVTRGHSATSISASGYIYASSSGGSNKWNNEVVTAARSYTVPARASYAVTYNANGGTGSRTDTKWYAENLTLASGTEFSREGYKLLKWNTASDGSGTDYSLSSIYSGNAALTLYAIWQENPSCTVTVSSSAPYYNNQPSYSVTISNAEASTALDPTASIDSIVLDLGGLTDSRSSDGELSITPTTTGPFTPIVTITDTLGASQTYIKPDITVKQYIAPSVVMFVDRTNSVGKIDETDGTSAVISATFTFCDDRYDLEEPTVTYTDTSSTTSATVSWYTARGSDGTIDVDDPSIEVDWGDISSGQTIYGLIASAFSTLDSYTLTLIPEDERSPGTSKTQTLSAAFYPIDFYAGGKGVAIGRAANDEGFFSSMLATFENDVSITVDENAGSESIDYKLMVAFASLGWTMHNDSE